MPHSALLSITFFPTIQKLHRAIALGTLRVEFIGPDGKQLSLPASCTTLAVDDPYTHFAGPEALFRFPDLMALAELIGLMREPHD